MNNINNNIYFGAHLHTNVTLNRARWNEIGKHFEKLTQTCGNGKFYLVHTTSTSVKPKKHLLATKCHDNNVKFEDAKYIPNELLGKWLVESSDEAIAKKLAKIYNILKIRKQAIYDIRKSENNPVLQEKFADRFVQRAKQFADMEQDIILVKPELIDSDRKAVWKGYLDLKSDLYHLKPQAHGQKLIAKDIQF